MLRAPLLSSLKPASQSSREPTIYRIFPKFHSLTVVKRFLVIWANESLQRIVWFSSPVHSKWISYQSMNYLQCSVLSFYFWRSINELSLDYRSIIGWHSLSNRTMRIKRAYNVKDGGQCEKIILLRLYLYRRTSATRWTSRLIQTNIIFNATRITLKRWEEGLREDSFLFWLPRLFHW